MNPQDQLRLKRKQELVRLRHENAGHSISSKSFAADNGKMSEWLENDRSFICRGFSLFAPEGRIPFIKGPKEHFYAGESIILSHLDQLLEKYNSKLIPGKASPTINILDLGCGRGIALEDLSAYYGIFLNMKLYGDTLFTPFYQKKFSERGIIIKESTPSFDNGLDPKEGYSLIMANRVLEYLPNRLEYLVVGSQHLEDGGIFPIIEIKYLIDDIRILDQHNKMLANLDFLFEEFARLGWKIEHPENEEKMLIVKKSKADLHLRYLHKTEAQTLLSNNFSKELSFYKITN